MEPAANLDLPTIKAEPPSPDLPRFGALYFAAEELVRKVERELELAGPRGRRRDLLVRSTLAARRLSRALKPLAGID
jgi:hypothetical protein